MVHDQAEADPDTSIQQRAAIAVGEWQHMTSYFGLDKIHFKIQTSIFTHCMAVTKTNYVVTKLKTNLQWYNSL